MLTRCVSKTRVYRALSASAADHGRQLAGQSVTLTIAGTVALHHKSYDSSGSTGKRGLPCAVSPPLKRVSLHLPRAPPRRRGLEAFLVV
jgi:hypothetical protein